MRAELSRLRSDESSDLSALRDSLRRLERLSSLPCSVYFNAVREGPYTQGGEECLTFSACTNNAGGGMDPEAGTFTAPINGAYLFSATVCSHDRKKVLVAIRRNDVEIASLYDQVTL